MFNQHLHQKPKNCKLYITLTKLKRFILQDQQGYRERNQRKLITTSFQGNRTLFPKMYMGMPLYICLYILKLSLSSPSILLRILYIYTCIYQVISYYIFCSKDYLKVAWSPSVEEGFKWYSVPTGHHSGVVKNEQSVLHGVMSKNASGLWLAPIKLVAEL